MEFLRIPMSPELQVAFFNTDQQDRIQRLLRIELHDEEIAARLPTMDRLDSSLLRLLHAAMFETPQLRGKRPNYGAGPWRRV